MTTDSKYDAALERVTLWRDTVEAELQDLVTQAARIREQINTAKTDYKKRFYEKKFKKITADVMRMVVAKQRLDNQHAGLTAAQETETNEQSDAVTK